ncbi:hypothetical protein O6H91_Y292600 [Diphasiastrum complanatum]|nr:hypothetical protein O6H91_Y292600 [Diphasiastrum complanatum]KAJ7290903.1 hypothetical protein O6H91_Y292600 [Diphasiastrum complanatum]
MSSIQSRKDFPVSLGDWIASSTESTMEKCKPPSHPHGVESLCFSARGLRSLSDHLQVQKKKGGIAFQKGGPISVFCMSGPVTHADDDDEEDCVLAGERQYNAIATLAGDKEERITDAIICTDDKKSVAWCLKEKAFLNGDFYCGLWKANLPHGTGKYVWSDGCMYEGEWERGKKSGRGKFSWPSGATHEGDFVGGYIHGLGTYTGVGGTTYRGNWSVNVKHGLGRMRYSNGDVYEGSWKHGVQDGPGRYTWANGNVYMGDWKGGVMSGSGILTWCTGDVYDGEWMDGLQHCRGVYCWSDGSFYIGSWSRGLKDGKGVFVPAGSLPIMNSSASMNHQQRCELIDQLIALGIIRKWSQASKLDHDWFVQKSSLKSRRGSSFEKKSFSNLGTGEQYSPRNVRFNRRLALEDSLGVFRLEIGNGKYMSADTILEGEETSFHDYDTYAAPVLEREYVQGVLISEIARQPAWTVLYKNIKKRQRRQEKEVKRPGETIYKGHGSYGLMLNLQLGIRYTVGKISQEPRHEIGSSDFGPQACVELRFPRSGSRLTPCHESVDFRWKDYCPKVFRHLREMFKIDTADYMLSICGNDALRELASPGKSGSVFFLSHDDRYIIKTLRKSEVKVLLGMLPSYYHHVQMYENMLITKFFGVHRVKPFGGRKVRFVVMGNMLCTDLHIHRRYDLKGSLQGRWTDNGEIDENTTLKDLDLKYVFQLEPSWREALLKQLVCDCRLLESQGIMDYSVLLGLHFRAPQHSATLSPELSTVPTNLTHSSCVTYANEQEMGCSHRGLVLVPRQPGNETSTPGLHVRGSPFASTCWR